MSEPTEKTEPYTAQQFLDMLQGSGSRQAERKLHIVVHSPGNVGGTPSVAVKQAFMGFDWDSKKLLLYPDVPLTKLTPQQVEDITTSVRKGQSWHAYEHHKKQANEIRSLKMQLKQQADIVQGLIDAGIITEEQCKPFLPAQNIDEKTP